MTARPELSLTLPEVRERLMALADRLGAYIVPQADLEEIRYLAEQTRRRPPVRVTRCKRAKFTPELAVAIRAYAASHRDASYMEMGEHFNVSSGRISEALAGYKGEDELP